MKVKVLKYQLFLSLNSFKRFLLNNKRKNGHHNDREKSVDSSDPTNNKKTNERTRSQTNVVHKSLR